VTEPTNAGPDEPTAKEPTDETGPAAAAAPTGAPEPPAAAPEPSAAAPSGAPEPSAAAPEPPAADPMERFRTRHSVPSGGGSSARWLAAVALVVALCALGGAGWLLYRAGWNGTDRLATAATTTTTSVAQPGPSPQQVADAKAKACDAYDLASKAVNVSNSASGGNEPVAAAVNVRLAMVQAHTYLLERLDPATPPPLADAIRTYAANVEDVTTSLLAGIGADDPAQAARIKDWGPLNDQITDMCK
jgi:hypothetical protein